MLTCSFKNNTQTQCTRGASFANEGISESEYKDSSNKLQSLASKNDGSPDNPSYTVAACSTHYANIRSALPLGINLSKIS
ncbi:MAG: hypothetical protein RLZZ210_879 [Pseudomonadota bacterium]|jgi:hypothetical protein